MNGASAISRGELGRRLIDWVGLTAVRPGSVAETVHRLSAVQIDPMQVVAPAHLWTLSLRRGPTPLSLLDRELGRGRLLEAYCHARCLVHRDDAQAMVAGWRRRRAARHIVRYGVEDAARQVMATAETGVSFTSRELDAQSRVSGFWDAETERRTKATSVAVDLLWAEGRLAVVGRRGGQKLYRLMEGHLPDVARQIDTLGEDEAQSAAILHSLRAYGVVMGGGVAVGWGALGSRSRAWIQQAVECGWLAPLRLTDGPAELCWALPALMERPLPRASRYALLAPVDNLLWGRRRLEAVFHFRYRWEAYTPASARRGGSYNMPVLARAGFYGEADAQWRNGRLHITWRPAEGAQDPGPAVVKAGRRAEALCLTLRT